MRKKRRNQKETYPPVEEWFDAPERFRDLPLRDGEYTSIIDPHTGMGLYLIAKFNKFTLYHSYLDGCEFRGNFKKVTPMEIHEREKERDKFL